MSDGTRASFGTADIDRLVERAMKAIAAFARRGSMLTTAVGLVALVVVGLAYLTGLAALDGGAQAVWIGVGAAMLIASVGAPLLASFRLRAIPRHSAALAGELRTLLGRNAEAKRVVIETVAADEGTTATMPSGQPVPAVVFHSQHYTRLHTIVDGSEGFAALAAAFRSLAGLPGLISVGLALTGLGGFLGFVFLLIWIF